MKIFFKIFLPFAMIMVLLLLFDIIFGDIVKIRIKTGLPISIFTKIDYFDHIEGEFAVDGYEYGILYLKEKQTQKLIKKVKESNKWRDDDFDEWLKTKIERYAKEEDTTGIRNVENGYWFFRNIRSNATDIYNYDNYIANLNDAIPAFIVAVLDTDNNILYYYELIG